MEQESHKLLFAVYALLFSHRKIKNHVKTQMQHNCNEYKSYFVGQGLHLGSYLSFGSLPEHGSRFYLKVMTSFIRLNHLMSTAYSVAMIIP